VAQGLKLGNPLEADTALGPLVSARQKERVTGYIEAGKAEGATVLLAGQPPKGKGYYVVPTIFSYTDPNIKIVREEIFGPVLVATPFDDLQEVVPRANATSYGLGGGIFTTNLNNAHRLAAGLNTGNVWINSYSLLDPTMPFGGFKESGWGRELSETGLDAYLETKSVYVRLA
jgi:phenylacetaldehyde dehydrogenase